MINNIQQLQGFTNEDDAKAFAEYTRAQKIKRRQKQKHCNACGAALNRTTPLTECNECLERELEFRLNAFESRLRRGALI